MTGKGTTNPLTTVVFRQFGTISRRDSFGPPILKGFLGPYGPVLLVPIGSSRRSLCTGDTRTPPQIQPDRFD